MQRSCFIILFKQEFTILNFRLYFLAAIMLPIAARAATQTTVPMQGGMVMPMIAYDTGLGRLQVMMPTNVPQLTPLLVSHPADQFDPLNPWFGDLDPSAMGQSFSRRYGFVMDAESDPLPAGTGIWLRKISGSDDLHVYRYSATPSPGVWQPVFGTAGTSNALAWNLMMFHPAFTTMPGTNRLTATFEAYLVNTQTMTVVENSSTGPMEFNFTNVPDGRPDLNLGISVAISWDPSITNYAVEYASSLTSTNWILATNAPVEIDGQSTILLPTGDAAGKFYRMRYMP